MQGPSEKRARARACKNCRIRKRRCIPASSNLACRLCQSLSVRCSLDANYDPISSRRALQSNSFMPSTPKSSDRQKESGSNQDPLQCLRVSRDFRIELVSLYFRFIHNVAHSLFHEISFMRSIYEERESTLLVLFMAALSARYSTNHIFEGQMPRLRGQRFFSEAKTMIYEKLTSPSLESIQAFLLAGTFMGGEGDLQAKHIYVELARSHSEALGVWESRPELSQVSQEQRRRTWLTVLILGEWTAADISIDQRHPDVWSYSFPLFDDMVFHKYGPENLTSPSDPATNRYEMWAQMAKSLRLFSRTSELLRRLSHGIISFATYYKEVPALSDCLDKWNENLPHNLVYSIANLDYLAGQGLGRTFLAMHIGYYHLRQILFFPFLESRAYQSLNAPDHLHYAAMCKRSAHKVSEIVKIAAKRENCELNYFIYGHIAAVSSCVHLHALLLSDREQESTIARQCLISNFEFLITLKKRWPVVDISVARLRTFQDYCRSSMSDPFILDNWMARFITEHTSRLDDPQGIRDHRTKLTSADESFNLDLADSNSKRSSDAMDVTGSLCQPLQGLDSWARTDRSRRYLQDLLHDSSTSHEVLVDNAFEWLLG
ncbi:hypothetical protein BDV59DRAFT_196505 [Aspergillus ambiguus]|uniref:putative C6 transcription factor n=1 Tax=Aspergillus ambiguus TaxID=176160 RepID=UPI003CCCC6BD